MGNDLLKGSASSVILSIIGVKDLIWFKIEGRSLTLQTGLKALYLIGLTDTVLSILFRPRSLMIAEEVRRTFLSEDSCHYSLFCV